MPSFSYKAKDSKGAMVQGVMDADGRPAVVARLQAMGLFPVLIEGGGGAGAPAKGKSAAGGAAAGGSTSGGAKGGLGGGGSAGGGAAAAGGGALAALGQRLTSSGGQRIRQSDLVSYNRQIADLLSSGVPLVKALSILVGQTTNIALREILSQVNSDVQGGATLALAMSKHPKVYPPLHVAMVKAGETGGMLDQVLLRLADFSEAEEATRGKVKSALAYPAIMIFAGIGAVTVVMTVVVPRITTVFASLNQALPLPTQILITISNFLGQKWWLILGALAVAVVAVLKWIDSPEGRKVWHRLQLTLPVVGPLFQRKEVAQFARTLGSLLHNGVPILQALDIVREVANNVHMKAEIENIAENVTQGAGVARALKGSTIFPPVVVSMINVGEETGHLDRSLLKVAESNEREVDRSVKMLTSLIEPIVIFIMALVVGFIVISIMLPIFSLDPSAGSGG